MSEIEYEEDMANFDLLIASVQKLQTDYNQLQNKFDSACFLLREAVDTLDRMDSDNYPIDSIMHFLEENNKYGW